MRTVDFSTVMFRFLQVAGLDRSNVTAESFGLFRDLANTRLEQIWTSEYWPELMRTSTPPGETVTTDSNGVRTVTLSADVGELVQVYDRDPRVTTRSRGVKWYLYENGTSRYLNLMTDVNPVFLEYRTVAPTLFGEAWSSSTAYSVGAQVYFDASTNTGSFTPDSTKAPLGNLYNCIVATTAGQSPQTTAASWEKVEIPFFAADYLVRACVADYLRSEGQFEQALTAESDAEAARMREVDKVLRQEGQIRTPSVFTY